MSRNNVAYEGFTSLHQSEKGKIKHGRTVGLHWEDSLFIDHLFCTQHWAKCFTYIYVLI